MKHFNNIKKFGTEQEKHVLRVITSALDFLANNAHYNYSLYKKASRITSKTTFEIFNEVKKLYDKIFNMRIDFVKFRRVANDLHLSIYHILALDYNINRALIRYYKKYPFKPDNSLYMCAVRTFKRFIKKYSEKYIDNLQSYDIIRA